MDGLKKVLDQVRKNHTEVSKIYYNMLAEAFGVQKLLELQFD